MINEQNIMHIQIDSRKPNSIISYSDSKLIINDITYSNNVIISNHDIISPWLVNSLADITEAALSPIIQLKPEIILIGHSTLGQQLPQSTQHYLSKQRIGVECMPIGSGCRTFNVLLSEERRCILGIIF
jgi:uncharacterized protein